MKQLTQLLKIAATGLFVIPAAVSLLAFVASFFVPVGTYAPAVRADLGEQVKTISGFYPTEAVPKGVNAVYVTGWGTAGTVRV